MEVIKNTSSAMLVDRFSWRVCHPGTLSVLRVARARSGDRESATCLLGDVLPLTGTPHYSVQRFDDPVLAVADEAEQDLALSAALDGHVLLRQLVPVPIGEDELESAELAEDLGLAERDDCENEPLDAAANQPGVDGDRFARIASASRFAVTLVDDRSVAERVFVVGFAASDDLVQAVETDQQSIEIQFARDLAEHTAGEAALATLLGREDHGQLERGGNLVVLVTYWGGLGQVDGHVHS